MQYQVSIYDKKRDRNHFISVMTIEAPSRRQAKIILKNIYGRNVVFTFLDEQRQNV